MRNTLVLLTAAFLLTGCDEDDVTAPVRCSGTSSEDCWRYLGLDEWILSLEETPQGLFAGTSHNGALEYRGGGTSWKSIGLEHVRVEDLLYHSASNSLLAGVTDTIGYPTEHDIYAWNGLNWEARDAQPEDEPDYRGGAYELVGAGDTLFWGAITPNIFRSTDGGREWHLIYGIQDAFGGPIADIHISRTDPSVLRAAGNTAGMKALYMHSSDRGASWNYNYFIPLALSREDAVFDLAVDPLSDLRLWAATSAGPMRSDDAGATWQLVETRPARALVLHPNRYLAFGIEQGPTPDGQLLLLESTDAGDTWKEVVLDTPIPAVTTVEPTADGQILVGTVSGVWLFAPRSMD